MLHAPKLKSYESNIAEINEQIKQSNNEILELVQDEEFDYSTFLFNDKINDLVSRIETCLALPSSTKSTNAIASDLDSVSSNP